MRCCALICPWKVWISKQATTIKTAPVPMPTYHGEMGLTSNNWEVNDYELNQVIRFLTPDTFGLSGRATLDSNDVLEQY